MNKISEHKSKEFDSKEFVNDIFELKTPIFRIRINDKSDETIVELFADGQCITTTNGNPTFSTFVINVYRAILSIALGSPTIRTILLKDGKLSNFIAPYLESNGWK